MKFSLKGLSLIGTDEQQNEEIKKRVVFVNCLNLTLAALILPIGAFFSYVTGKLSILVPASIEFTLTVLAIQLNYKRKYQSAAILTFGTQCAACFYFGLLLRGIIELQGMIIFLISIIYQLFGNQNNKARLICLSMAVSTLISLRVLLRFDFETITLEPKYALIFDDLTAFGVIVLIIVVSRSYVINNDLTAILRKANEHVKMFVTTITHEMRTPLNAIGLISKILKKEIRKNPAFEPMERYADMIIVETNTTRNIVNNVLDLAEVEAGKIEQAVKQTFFVKAYFVLLINGIYVVKT